MYGIFRFFSCNDSPQRQKLGNIPETPISQVVKCMSQCRIFSHLPISARINIEPADSSEGLGCVFKM